MLDDLNKVFDQIPGASRAKELKRSIGNYNLDPGAPVLAGKDRPDPAAQQDR